MNLNSANKLELYWSEIPVGKENAITYPELIAAWGKNAREVRLILHDLSLFDNGDDYILIRSAKKGGGFYRTDNASDIKEYREECLAKGRSNFAPVKKINRVLRNGDSQLNFTNNLRVMREAAGLKQSDVCEIIQEKLDRSFDVPMLSKMENGFCIPTLMQCRLLAELYKCETRDLINYDVYL